MTPKPTPPSFGIVVLAVFQLGGDSKYVDTEDIAIQSHQIAPGRFAWRKYLQQVNLELVRVALNDAKQKKGLVLGSGNTGWMLTPSGVAYAKANAAQQQGTYQRPFTGREGAWLRNERVRLAASPIFAKFQTQGIRSIEVREAERFFRLDDYIVGEARKKKLALFENGFMDDPELGPAVSAMAELVRGNTNHE